MTATALPLTLRLRLASLSELLKTPIAGSEATAREDRS